MRQIALLLGVVAAAIVLTALGSQYLGGLVPCPLCLQQRLPYYVGVPLALFAAWVAPRAPSAARGLLVPLAVIFVGSAALGAYHAGVEYGWWLGPQNCGTMGETALPDNINDLSQLLQTTKPLRCEDPAFTLFNISMAGYNFIASCGLAALALFGLLKGETK